MGQTGNDLITKFNQGDTGAFSVIYNQYYPNIYHFVKRFVMEREDAEDITADIFVKLWRIRNDLTTVKNVQAFLYVTAKNTCIDFLRHQRRQHEKHKELLYVLVQEPAEGILNNDLKTDVLQYIYEEIENLPPACGRAFKMSFLDNLSNDAIAEIMQINNQSVRNHKQRAIKLLRIAVFNRNILVAALIYLYFPAFITLR